MCNIGDKIYAITKNTGTFQLEITEAVVSEITDTHIIFTKRKNALISNRWEFPKAAWGKEIFANEADAITGLDHIVNWRKYEEGDGV